MLKSDSGHLACKRAFGNTLWMLLLPLCGLGAAGPTRLEKTIDTTPNPRILLTNLSGRITVKGWDREQVHSVCLVASPRVEVDTESLPGQGERAEKVHFDTHVLDPLVTGKDQIVDCSLDVPVGAGLEIRNRQGSVHIEGLQGEATLETVGAKVTVLDLAGRVAVHTVGGDIEIIRSSGEADATSINGSLYFVSPSVTQLRAKTTFGNVAYKGDFLPGGDYELSTYSGNIEIECPASSSFELQAKTVRGKLDNALPLRPKAHSPYPRSASTLLGTRNTGKATVEVTSYSGAIRIRPQP